VSRRRRRRISGNNAGLALSVREELLSKPAQTSAQGLEAVALAAATVAPAPSKKFGALNPLKALGLTKAAEPTELGKALQKLQAFDGLLESTLGDNVLLKDCVGEAVSSVKRMQLDILEVMESDMVRGLSQVRARLEQIQETLASIETALQPSISAAQSLHESERSSENIEVAPAAEVATRSPAHSVVANDDDEAELT
jgi:hypothetical protein